MFRQKEIQNSTFVILVNKNLIYDLKINKNSSFEKSKKKFYLEINRKFLILK